MTGEATERAEQIARYRKLEAAGRLNPIRRYKPATMDSYPAALRAALTGHVVRICEQDYLAPLDQGRADRGLGTGLVNRTRRWMEVDGWRMGSDRPTVEEVKAAVGSL